MTRVTVTLEDRERDALQEFARRERRDPRDQAALFVRDGLLRVGVLQADQPLIADRPVQASGVHHGHN